MQADDDRISAAGLATVECSFCGRAVWVLDFFRVYDVQVCRDCREAFSRRRQIAFVIDLILWGLLMKILEGVINMTDPAPFIGFGLVMLSLCVLYWKDGWRGMSPGKWLMDLQVVDVETLRPAGFRASFKRNLVLLAGLVAVLIIWADMREGRRWGDRWAGTKVIWRRYADRPPFDRPMTLCRVCRYDLTGNVSRVCPECSAVIPDRDREAIAAKGVGAGRESEMVDLF